MGKIVGFVFILFFLAIPALVVFLFIKALSKGAKQKKESSWKGKLINKDHTEYEDDDSAYTKDLYTLTFKTDGSEKKSLNVPKAVYDEFSVGDKAEKEKGQMHPRKIK